MERCFGYDLCSLRVSRKRMVKSGGFECFGNGIKHLVGTLSQVGSEVSFQLNSDVDIMMTLLLSQQKVIMLAKIAKHLTILLQLRLA